VTAIRRVRLGPRATRQTIEADGSIVLRSVQPLAPYPARLTERLEQWAERTPDAVFLAKRGKDGAWRTLRYGETLAAVRRIGQALLDRPLSADRPIAILSGNDLEHGLLALAAQHVGVPYAPISPELIASVQLQPGAPREGGSTSHGGRRGGGGRPPARRRHSGGGPSRRPGGR